MKKIISIFVLTIFVSSQSYAGNENITNAAATAATGALAAQTISNTTVGTTWVKKCTSAWPYCAMAALAFAQAAMSLKGAKDAKKTKDASECVGAYCGGGDGGNLNGGGTLPNTNVGTLPGNTDDALFGNLQNTINGNLENLANQGYTYDANTNSVNTPNGSVSSSSLGSDAGLKSLGLSDAEIRDARALAADALKEASKYADMGGDFGGGGGRKTKAGPGYGSDDKAFDMNKYLAGLMNKGDARGVAGLEKKYGSDQIGVAQDNIFNMIHRRYEAKKPSLNP
ncbi:MAG: hypothetical protein V4596_09840 [Bdellovibrionota bacterium]